MTKTTTGSLTTNSKLDSIHNWLEKTAFIHKDLIVQTNTKYQSSGKTKTGTFASIEEDTTEQKKSDGPFRDEQLAIWSCKKLKLMKLIEKREHVPKLFQFSDFVSVV